uniref:(northern house mosquito) hypothetical protein n=1 Tax=Culex pipiens TaxID=7175 RepID=A0A8D8CT48_CULPI
MNGGMLLKFFRIIFRSFFQAQMDSNFTPDQVSDVEMTNLRHNNLDVATEATVQEWFGIINEIRRNSVLPGPRSLAELAFAAISVPEPLAGIRIRIFEPTVVFPGPRSLAELAYDAIPVPESSSDDLSNFFEQSAVGLATDPLAVPNSMCNYFNSNFSDESVVDPIPSGSPSDNQIQSVIIDLEPTAAVPNTELPVEQNLKVNVDCKYFWCYDCRSPRNSLPWTLRLRYSKFSMISRYFSFIFVCILVAFLFVFSFF